MSIFKVKQWWSNNNLSKEIGVQNAACLKVDKFSSHSDSDCIVIGEGQILKLYKPNFDQDTSHVLLETQLNDPILHIETGKFIANSEDRQILVLHPQSYAIYKLTRKEGHINVGDQNSLESIVKHTFTKPALSVICGPFGNIKTRDFICIQSLDGSLNVFDQDTFLFMCTFDDVIIPGPVCYVANSDSFVICKSTWVFEVYSYQQLRELSDLNQRQNKKIVPQWVYNAGEEVSYLQAIQTSSNFSSIIVLGERHLYCFQDNGLMKYMIKFDFMPICFSAYLIGWYYEPTSRLIIMVASEDSKLYIYENTSLLWCCDLPHVTISISRCFLKSVPGGIATLSTNGVVQVIYLGTEPDLNSNASAMIHENMDPEMIQAELEKVEESLQKIMENKEGLDGQRSTDEIVKTKLEVGKPVQNLYQEFINDNDAVLHLLMCPVVLVITCEDPALVKSIQITFVCPPPFTCSDSVLSLDSVNGTEILETQIFLANDADISKARVEVLLTVTDASGKIDVLSKYAMLPCSLYCIPAELVLENNVAVCVSTNQPCKDLKEIFNDFSGEEITKYANTESVTFSYRNNKKTVTVKSLNQQYSIEADDYSELTPILDFMLHKLKVYYTKANESFSYDFKFDEDFSKHIIVKLLKSVEIHAKERIKLKTSESELNSLQRQFTLVQKRLLVQYGSLPPGDCDPLEYLMRDTHKRLVSCANEIIVRRETVCRAGNTVTSVGNFVVTILKQSVPGDFQMKLIEEMLALDSLYEDFQELEETVTQALSYIIKEVFKKSDKDKEKLAPVTEQGILSHINLKRFLKQIRMILERMFSEARSDEADGQMNKEKILRIQEFVDVI